ncbi:MAG TPA: phosphotransferase [Stellaceae bacterium]|nr:phosphotransferase [Stellaceae bacterium]
MGAIGRDEIAALIPHAGAMVLLEEVLRWDATSIVCRTARHRDPGNPLRRGGRLGVACAVELAAQAMAAHGRLAGSIGERPREGYLASLREVVCRGDRLDDIPGDLLIEVERLIGEEARVLYRFAVGAGGEVLASGRAAVVLAAEDAGTG